MPQLDENEIWFEFSHATGPGGQNVNKCATRVTVCFAPESSSTLTEWQKARVRHKLAGRISKDGILRVSASENRSQSMNREIAIDRLQELINEALVLRKKRRATRRTRSSNEKRLQSKSKRSSIKQARTSSKKMHD